MAGIKRIHVFDIGVYAVILLFSVLTVYPFLNIAAVSMSRYSAYLLNPMMVIPRQIDWSAYVVVLQHPLVGTSYRNTILTTVFGTTLSMVLTILTAYPLSRAHFKARPFFVYMIIFTMLFSGGLIPNFYLIRSLGLYNTLAALILPGCLSTYNMILLINFFKTIPDSLVESARIDGASDLQVLTKIVLPLSLAILATLSIFYAVGRWNSFFNAIIYIRDRNKWTLQLLLREVVLAANNVIANNTDATAANYIPTMNVRYATIVVSVLPILTIYPFLQRFFIKGVVLGAIKG